MGTGAHSNADCEVGLAPTVLDPQGFHRVAHPLRTGSAQVELAQVAEEAAQADREPGLSPCSPPLSGGLHTVQQSGYARLSGILPIGFLGLAGYNRVLSA